MKTVTIPSDYNPFVVKVNNQEYFYKAGEIVEVPDEVAEVILHYTEAKAQEPEKLEYIEGFSYDPVSDAGKSLQVRDDGRGVEWGDNSGGGGGGSSEQSVIRVLVDTDENIYITPRQLSEYLRQGCLVTIDNSQIDPEFITEGNGFINLFTQCAYDEDTGKYLGIILNCTSWSEGHPRVEGMEISADDIDSNFHFGI